MLTLLAKFKYIWKEVYYIERNIAFRNIYTEQFENKWKLFTNCQNYTCIPISCMEIV